MGKGNSSIGHSRSCESKALSSSLPAAKSRSRILYSRYVCHERNKSIVRGTDAHPDSQSCGDGGRGNGDGEEVVGDACCCDCYTCRQKGDEANEVPAGDMSEVRSDLDNGNIHKSGSRSRCLGHSLGFRPKSTTGNGERKAEHAGTGRMIGFFGKVKELLTWKR